MKPILVHCHIFYPEYWPELRACIANLHPHPFELVVTMVEPNRAVMEAVWEAFPATKLVLVKNGGYDIGPFLQVLKQVDLARYSYVVKVHTKRDLPLPKHGLGFRRLYGAAWREALLDFLKTPERVRAYLDAFEANPKIGMQAHYRVIVARDCYDRVAWKKTLRFIQAQHLPRHRFAFVGGTMFIARASVFQAFQALAVSSADFEVELSHRAQLAHVLERFLGYCVYQAGFILTDGLLSARRQKLYQGGGGLFSTSSERRFIAHARRLSASSTKRSRRSPGKWSSKSAKSRSIGNAL